MEQKIKAQNSLFKTLLSWQNWTSNDFLLKGPWKKIKSHNIVPFSLQVETLSNKNICNVYESYIRPADDSSDTVVTFWVWLIFDVTRRKQS
jgi:hypothetical protein